MGSGGLLKVKMSRMNQDHSWQTLRNNSHSPLPCDSHSYSLIVTQLLAVGHAHRAITAFSLSHCETQLLTAERAHCVTTTFLLRDSYSCSVLSFLLSLPPSHSRSHSQLYSIWFSFSVIKRKHKAKCVRSGGACELIWCHHGLCHYICHQHQRERGRERESSLHSSVEPELYPNNAYDVPWVDYQALALRRPCFGAHQHSLYKPTFPQV
ncbi:hypothetical protein JHK84_050648 [Glycine max]|nr:hypothetical protein JHK86_050610 [Glycine max]KAG4936532.1 hypothetical protein JHK85_051451 [Glycine max]KAG5095060.1 hypothetical protein JHK84_050648 [Glycine max]